MKSSKVMLAVLGIAVTSGMIYFLWSSGPQRAYSDLAEAKLTNEKLHDSAINQNGDVSALPNSIEGVQHSIQFQLAEDKTLVPTYAIREMFDHYLSTLGERDLAQVLAMIRSEIDDSLQEPARSEALALLKRYVDFKIALEEMQAVVAEQGGDAGSYRSLQEIHQEIIALRQLYFDAEESSSFFAYEDAQTDFMLEQLRINRDPNLSQQDKAQLLEQASRLLPESVVTTRERVLAHSNVRQQVTALRASGANDEEVYRFRAARLGNDAANGLAELDKSRAKWNSRLNAFSDERNKILSSGLSESDKDTAISELMAANFSSSESKRVRALIGDNRMK